MICWVRWGRDLIWLFVCCWGNWESFFFSGVGCESVFMAIRWELVCRAVLSGNFMDGVWGRDARGLVCGVLCTFVGLGFTCRTYIFFCSCIVRNRMRECRAVRVYVECCQWHGWCGQLGYRDIGGCLHSRTLSFCAWYMTWIWGRWTCLQMRWFGCWILITQS